MRPRGREGRASTAHAGPPPGALFGPTIDFSAGHWAIAVHCRSQGGIDAKGIAAAAPFDASSATRYAVRRSQATDAFY